MEDEETGAIMWTVRQFAAAAQIDEKTAYRRIELGDVPGVRRIGRAIRLHRETVEAWLKGELEIDDPT